MKSLSTPLEKLPVLGVFARGATAILNPSAVTNPLASASSSPSPSCWITFKIPPKTSRPTPTLNDWKTWALSFVKAVLPVCKAPIFAVLVVIFPVAVLRVQHWKQPPAPRPEGLLNPPSKNADYLYLHCVW